MNIEKRGGKRLGAGRPKKNNTKQVRIPENLTKISRQLSEIFYDRLIQELHNNRWYETCPENEKENIHLKNIRIQTIEFMSLMLDRDQVLCVAADAEHSNGESVFVYIRI